MKMCNLPFAALLRKLVTELSIYQVWVNIFASVCVHVLIKNPSIVNAGD